MWFLSLWFWTVEFLKYVMVMVAFNVTVCVIQSIIVLYKVFVFSDSAGICTVCYKKMSGKKKASANDILSKATFCCQIKAIGDYTLPYGNILTTVNDSHDWSAKKESFDVYLA